MQVVVRQQSRIGGEGLLCVSQPSSQNSSGRGGVTVPLGHVATYGSNPPASAKVLEIKEASRGRGDSGMRLQAAMDQVLPPPCRYRAVWTSRGPLTMWLPVPPTADYVALGMVATATSSAQPPPQDAIRCVPRTWVRRVTAEQLVWHGIEGSIWSTCHGFLVAAKGRQPPQIHELLSDYFKLDGSR